MGRPKKKPVEIEKPKVEEKKWIVYIKDQSDTFTNLQSAREYVKRLIDAGVWFIRCEKK